jgi:hypothetical protein
MAEPDDDIDRGEPKSYGPYDPPYLEWGRLHADYEVLVRLQDVTDCNCCIRCANDSICNEPYPDGRSCLDHGWNDGEPEPDDDSDP